MCVCTLQCLDALCVTSSIKRIKSEYKIVNLNEYVKYFVRTEMRGRSKEKTGPRPPGLISDLLRRASGLY